MGYLVTGANGNVGSRIVKALAARGVAVHTLSRKPAIDTQGSTRGFVGDLTAPSFDAAMFAGVERMFLFPAEGNVDGFLRSARESGVQRVVVLSSLAAAMVFPRDQDSLSARHHRSIEISVQNSGLEYTLLRPGSFANNLRQWSATIRSQGMVFGPYPDSAQALIHEADIADVAVEALCDTRHAGKTYSLTGPEAITQIAQLETIAKVIGKPLRFQKITPEAFRESMLRFVPEAIVKMLLDYWSDTEKSPDKVTNDVETVTGRPARSFATWVQDHVADFA